MEGLISTGPTPSSLYVGTMFTKCGLQGLGEKGGQQTLGKQDHKPADIPFHGLPTFFFNFLSGVFFNALIFKSKEINQDLVFNKRKHT